MKIVPKRATSNCLFGVASGLIIFTYKSCANADEPSTKKPEIV